ncbi:MAG: 1,4-alpha-glucan branching protein GlgB [Bacteroidia bacterium]|nr:1,4-alpha-glucan branching protein GlgB [Bacteroidia bacterium]NNF31071.1 1,4-alpha-glucan branching protein GlgB [Flavobacteriaceae bacterium]MBT8276965.1 1,4-alpha-glucan branching protein GlgB [Bacteroidia bacterium]NNJ81768.1 1,4-alpha-glucan branching protein GlgB [Flavobacteriaceae bacterium]NNK55304.1 1,4-alpha-glucan branching protein GlgB [Flavobacteriaceae bacterium]
MSKVITHSLFTEFDIDLFRAGKHFRLYEKLGAHLTELDGQKGVYFAVWAPSAKAVSVIGDFNFWIEGEHPLNIRWDSSGIWEGFIPGVEKGSKYKYKIHSHHGDVKTEKADPFAARCEHPPNTASIVWDTTYVWRDKSWMNKRKDINRLDKPFSVYEMHIGSWMHNAEEDRPLTYLELAKELTAYLKKMNFTHVEFMPVMEYPYDPSWGYQLTGYFAPTSRFGKPEDFMYLVDELHKNDIGVILDWVPSHFPEDAHGLGNFDGSHLYEHPDRRKGYHPDWKSLIFNYGRNEVRAFLISNAIFWLDRYHADGLRVDAVASMLYLDYSREDGEWEPNQFGGRENLDAISFFKELNEEVYGSFEGVQTIAEESTSFPMVSKPTYIGGLGFGMKWMMGWMHDTLEYFKKEPIYRKHHQNDITFSMTYAFTENFMLPLSHDEVVYGKQSILGRMPGDEWQRFANLRLLYGYMFTHPGSKLLFMGGEFGQGEEWNFQQSLDWHLLEHDYHKGIQKLVAEVNKLYRKEPALHQKQFVGDGFEWIDYNDAENSVLAYIRKGEKEKDDVILIANMTPIPREDYRIGLPASGKYKLIFNSDDPNYGGSGYKIARQYTTDDKEWQFRKQSVALKLPPLSIIALKRVQTTKKS